MHQIHIKLDTIGKKEPIQSSLLRSDQKRNYKKGIIILAEEVKEGSADHWLAMLYPSKEKYYFYKPHVEIKWDEILTYDQLSLCFPSARKIDLFTYHDPINVCLSEFKIDTPARIAAFLAQIGHESGNFKYKEELASGEAYEGRIDLGNVNPGDGKKYKGRGLIQLTGRDNYRWASRALGINLIDNPLLATTPSISARIAGLYWDSKGLNKLADINTTASFKDITKRINGGLNGWTDRLNHWERIKKVIF